MPKIKYALHEKYGEWTDVNESERDALIIIFDKEVCGYIFIENHAYRVEKGEAKIPINSFAGGEYAPRLECEAGVFDLEGFIKSGTDISMLKTSESTLRRMLSRTHKYEEAIAIIQSEIADLKSKTEGHHIFKY